MHLKLKGFRLSVLHIYTIAVVTLTSVAWSEPTLISHLGPQYVSDSVLTTTGLRHPPGRQGGEQHHLDSTNHLGNRDKIRTKTSRERHRAIMASSSDTSSKNDQKPKQTKGELLFSASFQLSAEDCSRGNIERVVHGKFYIVGQLEANINKLNVDFQSDSAAAGQDRVKNQRLSGSDETWQRLQPVVECGGDAMTLTVRRRRAVQLLLDGANESSIPLSQLLPQCGYSVFTTWRDLSLKAQYDACHVTQEGDSYVLPLLWRGAPVKMSCPVSLTQPQAMGPSSLCCSTSGLTVTVQDLSATEELRINVRGEWTPVVLLAEQCGYIVDTQETKTVIAAPYLTCGITVKDGKYSLSLQMGGNIFFLSCPVSPTEETPLTPQPLVDSPHHLSRGSTESDPDALRPFPWAPPFYLAPPYYPHPTKHHKYPRPDVHNAHNPPTPPPLTPDPTVGPQHLRPDDSPQEHQEYYSRQIPVGEYKHFSARGYLSSTDSSHVYPDLRFNPGRQEVFGLSTHSETGFPVQEEAPSLQPPNPYYHYYHHPKIPLPSTPQDPDPGPEVPDSHTHEFPLFSPDIQQSEAVSDHFPQPVLEAATHPYVPLTSPVPHPQPYPHHYFYYFPHIARGEAKKFAPPPHHMASKTNLSHIYPLSRSLVHPVHEKDDMNLNIDRPNHDEIVTTEQHKQDWRMKSLWFKDDNVQPEQDDKKRHITPLTPVVQPHQHSYPTEPNPVAPAPQQLKHNQPPFLYYFPNYHYYQMYHGPQSAPSADKEALDPSLQAPSFQTQPPSYPKHQTTSSTDWRYDVYSSYIHPSYYYYLLFLQSQVSKDDGEFHPAATWTLKNMDSSDSRMDVLVHAAEKGYPSIPQPLHSAPHNVYSYYYMTRQNPHDAFGHPDGEEKANAQASSALPCGFGSVTDVNCSDSLDCCSYPVKDCTMGQYFVFVVPDSVLEPTVASPVHPSEDSHISCSLQKLTSDPDVYIVPLHGCGVNKHMIGQTVVHQLEVQGSRSLHENSSVRLMVECSSSSDAPGEVKLHVMDQSPPPSVQSPPATVTVQLRIATDESFSSFHPDAHLPLSLTQGGPIYLEVRLLDPPEPDLVLLVHSCLAYVPAPYSSWIPIYNGCPSWGESQLLPSPHSDPHHIRRVIISSFLPTQSRSDTAEGGFSPLDDPEIYFLCWTEVCSAADGDCTVGCISSPNSDMGAME